MVADDVTAVINHLDQMVTLLLVDLKQIMAHGTRTQNGIMQSPTSTKGGGGGGHNGSEVTTSGTPRKTLEDLQEVTIQHTSLPAEDPPHTPIFDHFLGEEILDTILTWSLNTGEFVNAMKLEQLKVRPVMFWSRHIKEKMNMRGIRVRKVDMRKMLEMRNICVTGLY